MKLLLIILLPQLLFASELYEFKLKKANGDAIKLSEYKDTNILFVNIATRCGYTGQLDGLESLYKKYKDKDFTIIALPSNDFGGQTPEGNEGVAKFCRLLLILYPSQ